MSGIIYERDGYLPTECVELGQAIGTWLGIERFMITGRDGRPVSRYVRRAIVVGLASVGVSSLDLRMIPNAVLRFEIGKMGAEAGLYVAYAHKIVVELYDKEGKGVDNQTIHDIKNIMETKEFTKINMTELGSSSYYPNALDDYVTQITSKIKFKKSLRVLVDCKADPVGTLIPVLFEKYGIRSTLFNDFFSGYKLSKSREEFFDHLRRGDYNFGLIFNVDNIEIVTKTERVHVGKDIEDVLHFLRG